MSYRVYPYSLSGGKCIDWVPGVPLAAWGGPGRTQGAVGAAPKTRNYTTSRVKHEVRNRPKYQKANPAGPPIRTLSDGRADW